MLSYPEYEAVRDQSRAFDGVLAFSPFNPATLGGAEPRPVLATLASCNYFDVLRIRAAKYDPASFVLAPAFLFMIALAACYVPARRALRVEPTTALRTE